MFTSEAETAYDEGLLSSRLKTIHPILFPTPKLDWHFTHLSSDPLILFLSLYYFHSLNQFLCKAEEEDAS
jgi:hypothetical protein